LSLCPNSLKLHSSRARERLAHTGAHATPLACGLSYFGPKQNATCARADDGELPMGCCRYFFNALLVVAIAFFGLRAYKAATSRPEYGYAYPLPDWWWRARLPDSIEAVDATDTARLREALFGGEPWLLQCYSGLPFAGQHLPRPYRVHPAFAEALHSLRGIVRGGVLDCEAQLPSNKTVVAKLGLVRRTQPLLVLAYGGGAPKQLPASASTSAYGITAFVKPKAEPRVLSIATHKTFVDTCGGRRPCLLAQMDRDSPILLSLARSFRSLELVALGEDGKGSRLAWGRGDEIGETLDEDESRHLGKRVSMLLPDPDDLAERAAFKAAGHKSAAKRSANPPRLLRGFSGPEDLPSLSRFVETALKEADSAVLRSGNDAFMRIPLPTLSGSGKPKAPKKAKSDSATAPDNAEVQARRARVRKEKAEAEAAAAAERAAAQAQAQGETEAEVQRQREAARREQMQREQERADNLVEEVEEEEEEEEEEEGEGEEGEEVEMEDLDLDA
jgi:hypothetical protein